ncbi:uncharacterized protein LOC135823268 isoform X1 [Sycon ciliatum]|uniref:uncharacterized protein LOC135823268 isoform X1 n=2 Tax=Sycon ciliatum TaxID=27933 RepID=UPI0031F71412
MADNAVPSGSRSTPYTSPCQDCRPEILCAAAVKGHGAGHKTPCQAAMHQSFQIRHHQQQYRCFPSSFSSCPPSDSSSISSSPSPPISSIRVVPMGQHMLVLSPCIGKHMPLCQPQIQTDIPKGIFQPAESSTKLQTTFGHYFPQSARNPMPRNSLETPSPDSVMSKQADSKGTAKPQLLTTPSPDLSLGSPGQPANTHALQLCLQPAAAEFRQISSSRSTPGHCGSSRVHLQPTTMLVPLRPISSPCIATPISVSSGIGLDSNVRTSVHEDTSWSLPGYCSDRAHTLWQACSSGTEPPSNVERHSDGSLLQARRVMGVQSSPIYGTTLDKTFPTGAECPSDSVRFEAAYSSLAVDHQYSDSDSTCSSSTADAVGCPSESGILSDTASCYEDEISYGCGGEDALPLSLDMLKKVVEPSTAKQVFDSSATDVLHLWVCKNIQYPYATKVEKRQLARESRLTVKQVSSWLTNARRRLIPRLVQRENERRRRKSLPLLGIVKRKRKKTV